MNGEVAKSRQFVRLLPRFELGKLVRAHQQIQRRRLAQRRQEVAHRVDRVRVPAPPNLHVRGHEMPVAPGRQPNHREPMLRGRQFALRLMRWRRGRNEIYQVELDRLANFLGRAQMAEMNRIESAAEQSYPHVISASRLKRELVRSRQRRTCTWSAR